MKKYLALFILTLVLLPTINVKAQSNIRIERKTYITTGTREEAKFYTNKGFAYCITPRRTGADEGASLRYYGKETKGGRLYLFEKAGSSDYSYLTTQLAMWLYQDNYMPEYYVNNSNIEVVQKAKAMAADAAKHRNYETPSPSVDISTSNIAFTETSDGQYYKTGTITITAKNYKEEPKVELVSAPEGTKINYIDSKFINNIKRIEVQIPINSITASKKFQLKVTANGSVNVLEKYTTGNSELQDVVVKVPEKRTATKSIDLTVNPKKRYCEHHDDKYYGKDGNLVTKEEYEIQCESHVCEIIGNRYFGKDGLEVTELEYKEQCEPKQVIVPDTGSNSMSNIISIVIGSIMLGTVIGTLTHFYGKKKINY